MKKRSILILIVLIIIGVGAFFVIKNFNEKSKYNYKIEQIYTIDYNLINREGKYGVINRKGEVIIEPTYDAIQIPNPLKDVFICMYDYDTNKKEYKTKVLNSKGEQLYQNYDSVQGIPTETTYDGIPFEKTVLKYKENGKYGLISIDGKKIITKAIYDQISAVSYKEGMLLIKQGDKCGVININGKIVKPVEYENIIADNYYSNKDFYSKTGFIVRQKENDGYRFGYVNYKGKLILKAEYTEIERVTEIKDEEDIYLVAFKDGQAGLLKNDKVILNYEYEYIKYNLYNDVFVIQRNGKQGIANREGTIKIEPMYESVLFGGMYVNAKKDGNILVLDLDGNEIKDSQNLSKAVTEDGEHYIVSDKNEEYTIINKNGTNSINNKKYSYIEEIGNGYFIVSDGTYSGIINVSGKEIISLKYNSMYKVDKTDLIQANILNKENKEINLLNKEMKNIVSMQNGVVEVTNDYVRVYSEKENKYFTKEGKELTSKEVFPDNLLYAKKVNNKWGFVNKNGELKVTNEYDMVTEFNEYGFAGIKKDEKWGVIDSNGNVLQEPIYKIKTISPKFIGKFYQIKSWYENLYYTDKIEE